MLKPRLEKFYETVVCEDFILFYNFKNISNLPNFESLTLNSTSSNFCSNPAAVMQAFSGWLIGTGQKCVSTTARKSIAMFNIRKSDLLGLKVSCRRSVCFILLDKLLLFVLPRLLSNSAQINKLPGFFSRSPAEKEFSNDNKDIEIFNLNHLPVDVLHGKNKSKHSFTKSFFIISNNSTSSFPEFANLLNFFDCVSGFSLSCSIAHKNKGWSSTSLKQVDDLKITSKTENFYRKQRDKRAAQLDLSDIHCSTFFIRSQHKWSAFRKEKISCFFKKDLFQPSNTRSAKSIISKKQDLNRMRKQFISAFQYPENLIVNSERLL